MSKTFNSAIRQLVIEELGSNYYNIINKSNINPIDLKFLGFYNQFLSHKTVIQIILDIKLRFTQAPYIEVKQSDSYDFRQVVAMQIATNGSFLITLYRTNSKISIFLVIFSRYLKGRIKLCISQRWRNWPKIGVILYILLRPLMPMYIIRNFTKLKTSNNKNKDNIIGLIFIKKSINRHLYYLCTNLQQKD